MSQQDFHYSMNIEWSDKDNVYYVRFPAWENSVGIPTTYGKTFEEAIANGRDLFETLTEASNAGEIPPPSKIRVGLK